MPGLVAGLDALLVALVLLGAMFAVSAVFRPLLVNVLQQAPFIGGWLASNVDTGLRGFQSALIAPANASLYLVSSSLDWVAQRGREIVQGLTDVLNAALWTSYVIATVTIPDAVGRGLAQAENLVNAARAEALGLFQTAEHDVTTSFLRAEAGAAALTSALRSDLEADIQAAETVVLLEIRKAEQATGQLFQQAEYDAAQATAQVERQAGALFQQAEADLHGITDAIRRDLAVVADQAEAQLPEALRNLGRDLEAVREQAAAQGPEFQRNLDQEIADLKASAPWQLIANLEAEGENVVGTALADLVKVSQGALHAEVAGAKALQAKLAPFVRAVTAELRGR